MELLEVRTITSPNIFSLDQDVVQMRIKLEDFIDTPTKDIPGFNDKITSFFPGLIEHKCTNGYIGGFLDRLREGTYLAHVTEHLCLEVQKMLGFDVKYGKARMESGDIYKVIFACVHTAVGKACAYFIYEVVSKLTRNEEVAFAEGYQKLRKVRAAFDRGVSTGAIYAKARERGIPVSEVSDGSLIRLGYGKYQKFISATLFENTSSIAVDIACDKSLTKSLLDEVSVPVPEGQVCYTVQEAIRCAEDIGYPVVVKPKCGNKGRQVTVNITNQKELEKAFLEASTQGQEVIIEKFILGREYRILVVNGKVIAAAERIPARVKGDGYHNIKELIEIENMSALRGDDHEKPLTKIQIDEHVYNVLFKQGLDLDSIPPREEIVTLRSNSNLSTGGTAIDCTDDIHPYNKNIAESAVNALGLDIAGIDLVIPDISQPLNKYFGAVIEVNAAPGIRMHLRPSEGKSRDVVSPILDMIYPPGKKFAVPIVAITGTNGKTTTTRMISHILKTTGHTVGMTTTHGIYIDENCLEEGDTTGYKSAQRILNNRQIEIAVLETARGGIIKNGLGYNKADIAVFTNLSNDHLGIDGINSMEELFHVKSLVTEAVKPDGYCVLNADDPWALKARDKAGGNVILFSLDKTNPHLISHVDQGGYAVFLDNGSIYLSKAGELSYVMDIKSIPATLGGILKHNISNSLAAVGASFALGIPLISVNKAFRSFSCDPCVNPGRFNIYQLEDFRVVLDYGHNYDGYKVTIDGLKGLKSTRLTGIIGVPGDRRNDDIIKVGELAGHSFDQIIIKEDKDLRNRDPLEVAQLLKIGVLKAGYKKEIRIIPSEEDALGYAIKNAISGEVIIVFFEKMEPLVQVILTKLKAQGFNDTQNSRIDVPGSHDALPFPILF